MEDDNSITIHKSHCPVSLKIKSSSGNKLRSVEWRTHKVLSFPAILEIKGIDEVGVLKEIARIISEDYSINISKINIETKDGIFNGLLHIYVYSVEDINNLCMNLLKIAAVKSVNRIDTID
jgi:GTP pyrophosphokinase